MPGTLFDTDTSFPRFTGEETDSEKIQKLQDYLYQLAENFRYLMSNLGIENFNATELEELGTTIRKPVLVAVEKQANETGEKITQIEANIGRDIKGIKTQVTEIDKDVETNKTTIDQTSKMIAFVVEEKEIDGKTQFVLNPKCLTLSVEDVDGKSSLVLTSNGTVLESSAINLEGFVTFEGLNDSSNITYINGANIKTGTIEAGIIKGGTIIGKVLTSGVYNEYGELVQAPTISGATFEAIYNSTSKTRSGDLIFLSTSKPGFEQASIFFDEKQNHDDDNEVSQKRLFIMAKQDAALKLCSLLKGVSIEAGTSIYFVANQEIDLKCDGGVIDIGSYFDEKNPKDKSRINLRGDVYVNGKLIS